MGTLHKSAATIGFYGDDLNPAEVTAALGAEPTGIERVVHPKSLGVDCVEFVARAGGEHVGRLRRVGLHHLRVGGEVRRQLDAAFGEAGDVERFRRLDELG